MPGAPRRQLFWATSAAFRAVPLLPPDGAPFPLAELNDAPLVWREAPKSRPGAPGGQPKGGSDRAAPAKVPPILRGATLARLLESQKGEALRVRSRVGVRFSGAQVLAANGRASPRVTVVFERDGRSSYWWDEYPAEVRGGRAIYAPARDRQFTGGREVFSKFRLLPSPGSSLESVVVSYGVAVLVSLGPVESRS
jgi:hypothetical protein